MSFSRGVLSEEQRARIESNRKRALERLQARQGGSLTGSVAASTSTTSPNRVDKNHNVSPSKSKSDSSTLAIQRASTMTQMRESNTPITSKFIDPTKKELTLEQKNIIEANRQKALEIRRRLAETNRDGSINPHIVEDNIRLNHNNKEDFSAEKKSYKYEPPAIKRKDYIEYDFSTMKDSRGGFLPDELEESSSKEKEDAMGLEEWKEKQKKLQEIKELPPPLNIEDAPKCFECGSLEVDPNLYTNFRQVRACRKCMREKPEKYSLLTKTECKEDYLLTDPELKDLNLLPRIEKPNPHGYSRMQLFLRFQVEEYAWKKWGSSDGLDEEWEKRESNRLKRRDKKYNDQLKEMRKKTRAEEYTRKLRNGQGLGERHVHEWSAGMAIPGKGNENMIKRRCMGCGVETEEILI